jgi:SM-20-related protein
MALLDLDALQRAHVILDPFRYTVVREFVTPANAAVVRKDFPPIAYPGLLPVEATVYGPSFAALIEELRSPAVARVFSERST